MTQSAKNPKQIGRRAGRIFTACLPNHWVFRSQEDQEDYGIDGEIEILDKNEDKTKDSLIFKVQIKGTTNLKPLSTAKQKYSFNEIKFDRLQMYAQLMDIPVLLFVVDVEKEDIFWVELQNNEEIKAIIQKSTQVSLGKPTIHLEKKIDLQPHPKIMTANCEEDIEKTVENLRKWLQTRRENIYKLNNEQLKDYLENSDSNFIAALSESIHRNNSNIAIDEIEDFLSRKIPLSFIHQISMLMVKRKVEDWKNWVGLYDKIKNITNYDEYNDEYDDKYIYLKFIDNILKFSECDNICDTMEYIGLVEINKALNLLRKFNEEDIDNSELKEFANHAINPIFGYLLNYIETYNYGSSYVHFDKISEKIESVLSVLTDDLEDDDYLDEVTDLKDGIDLKRDIDLIKEMCEELYFYEYDDYEFSQIKNSIDNEASSTDTAFLKDLSSVIERTKGNIITVEKIIKVKNHLLTLLEEKY